MASKCKENEKSRQIQNLMTSELVGKEVFFSKHLYHIIRVILLYRLEGLPMQIIFH